MRPPSGPRTAQAEDGFGRYVELMLVLHPELGRKYFTLKKWGVLETGGIGSARTLRLLGRIEGPTDLPTDDIIIEAKEVRDLSAVPCMQTLRGDALRVVAGQASFGRRTDPLLAVVPRGMTENEADLPWWVQSWTEKYGEVDLETFESVEELVELTRTIAAQLAQGHLKRVPPPFDRQLAELVRSSLAEHDERIRRTIVELTKLTRDAHRQFSQSGKDTR
jgi:hypothetical protein